VENNKILRERLDKYFTEELSDAEKQVLEEDFYSTEAVKEQFMFNKTFVNSLEKINLEDLKETFEASHQEMEMETDNIASDESEIQNLSLELEYNIAELFSNLTSLKNSVSEI